MEDKKLVFSELPNIESVCAILGLSFPETATEFQKSAITLAHLMASLRDFVLKGIDVPYNLVSLVTSLAVLMQSSRYDS